MSELLEEKKEMTKSHQKLVNKINRLEKSLSESQMVLTQYQETPFNNQLRELQSALEFERKNNPVITL